MAQKVAFVSGATSGIGLATVRALSDSGWIVYAAALPTDDFSHLPEVVHPITVDITNANDVQAVAERIKSEVGYVNGLVNNAGIQIVGALETLSSEQIRKQFEVNVFGHLQVIQAMLPLLREGEQPRIVNVSSLMGKVAMPMLGAYSMSKHALEAMTDVLRLELAQWGIHVAAIEPGAVDTPMTNQMETLLKDHDASLTPDMQTKYRSLTDSMIAALETQGKQAVSAERVAGAILHALTSEKPKTRYPIGIPTVGLITMRNLAPDVVGDAILTRALRLNVHNKS